MAGLCSSATDAGATGTTHTGYQRRRPERSVLHQVVSQHIETLWAEAAAQSPHGTGYPSYVKHEFERFIGCGLLPGGFSRLRCRSCGAERLVGFSCKGRALCPSCVARRMADTAAHLVDRVLPRAAYRPWVSVRQAASGRVWLWQRKVTDGEEGSGEGSAGLPGEG